MEVISSLCAAYRAEDPDRIASTTAALMHGECSTATDAAAKLIAVLDDVAALASWSDAEPVQAMHRQTAAALAAVIGFLEKDADADALIPLRRLFGPDCDAVSRA
jgi:hypothetical protein